MKIFSKHRRKLEPKRRFGTRDFQNKIQKAQNYKRIFDMPATGWLEKFWRRVGLGSKWLRRLGVVLILVIAYYLVVASDFVIVDFHVTGNSQISEQTIQDVLKIETSKRRFFIKKAHYLFLTKGQVNQILTSKIPNIKEVIEYKPIWPRSASIVIKERTPGFAVKSQDNYFLIDDEGTVVKPLDEPGNLLVAEDSVTEDFASGEMFPNAKMAPFVISMARSWSNKIVSPIAGVKFPGKASNDVQFTSAEGWSVLFDIDRSVASQLINLNLILTKQIPQKDRANLAYIDLRSSKWAYYCFKGTACQQGAVPEETTLNEEPKE